MLAAAVSMMMLRSDWLVDSKPFRARLIDSGGRISLDNGLLRRTIDLNKNGTTVEFRNLQTDTSLLRCTKPEATIAIDGKSFAIGGLEGQPNLAFLRDDWLAKMMPIPGSFHPVGHRQVATSSPITWNKKRRGSNAAWPPTGIGLVVDYENPSLPNLKVSVHFEIFDGLPLMSKWIEIHNAGSRVELTSFVSEQLGLVEGESAVDPMPEWRKPNLTVVTDYSFGGMALAGGNKAVNWLADSDYKTQVNYELATPCVLEVRPPRGPKSTLDSNGTFRSMRAFELLHDSDDRERRSLAIRQMHRTLSPWATENPLMLHLTSTDPVVVRRAIDQASECGFEMVIFSFGSGLNMEDVSDRNIAKFREFRDYAHAKGLEIGGYSLLASRRINDEEDVINPKTGKTGGAIFGNSPCLGSRWGLQYFEHIKTFLTRTGFDLLEHDGSYPGDFCASTHHPGHSGLDDSQWNQFQIITEFYRWCRESGIFLNVPDTYFLAGSNKTGMGYRESNWSLPRDQQHIHARQNLFDGTWEKTPSMGWMMVPLVEYQGGGAAATIEPLHEHLADYRMHLTNNLAFGAQACYRGPRLYDTPETKAMVQERVTWFKKYRDILESDVIHIRRADSRSVDGILHVNPNLACRGMIVFFNPTDKPVSIDVSIPIYYTGLTAKATVAESDLDPKSVPIDANGNLTMKINVAPAGYSWYTVRK